MAQVPNFVLTDGKGTPVNHTFARVPSASSLIAAFRDSTAGLALLARATLVSTFRLASKANAGSRRTYVLSVPQFNTTTNLVECVVTARLEILTPMNASVATRTDVVAYLKDFTGEAIFANAVINEDEIN